MSIKQYSLKADGSRRLAPSFTVREFRCRDGSDVVMIDESLMPGWGGVGRYPVKAGRAKGWVHVDTRPNKSRWTQ